MNYVWVRKGVLHNGNDPETGEAKFVKTGDPLPKKFIASEKQLTLFKKNKWIVSEKEFEAAKKKPEVAALISQIAAKPEKKKR